MTAHAKRFPSPDAKVIRHGPMGIPWTGTCAECGETFRQPSNGRPRILCREKRCFRAHVKKRRASYLEPVAPTWTELDRDEAILRWHSRCAICFVHGFLSGLAFVEEILPAHPLCLTRPIPQRARNWLANCKPGCPLPNPFGGSK